MQAAAAIERACHEANADCVSLPVADGGEGTLEVLGGANRSSRVSGPLGDPADVPWRYANGCAVIEMALASGLSMAGGPETNDAVAATTYGTGELIADALDAGARRIIVGVGGSASTDGGLGALRAIEPIGRLRGIELLGACDVRTRFVDAARIFAPQKGASPAEVEFLERRLTRLAQMYVQTYGIDVTELQSSGAGGGLGGGLAAVGARLMSGFEVVADEICLHDHLERADLVVTGEGFLDDQSFDGKVVGGVIELAGALDLPVLVVVGEVVDDIMVDRVAPTAPVTVVSLVQNFGRQRAMTDTESCIQLAVRRHLENVK